MMTREVIQNEEARLNALRDLHLLDTPPSESFDRITRLASRLFQSPVSTISLTDRDRQWFKSRVGVDLAEIPRAEAPCTYAVQSADVFVVPDMMEDPRFRDSLLARAGIRFYAGAPLITRAGYGLGTLCIIDDKPRGLDKEERTVLADLAAMVMSQIELQNAFGSIDATSGHANENQLFEDIEDLGGRHPGAPLLAVLVEFASLAQVSNGQRVLGAAYAEAFVREATGRIRTLIGNSKRLYHVGQARCVVLDGPLAPKETLAGVHSWQETVDTIADGLRDPILCEGVPLAPEVVFGVYAFPAGEAAPRDVLRRLFNAAADARGSAAPVAAYDESQDLAHQRRFRLLNDIREALAGSDQLRLAYQPRIDMTTGRIVGVEALLRWHHPKIGDVGPAEFIPLVDDTAYSDLLTDWVLATGIAQRAAWRDMDPDCRLSINISAKNLQAPDFSSRLVQMLDQHGLSPTAIELELTEGGLLTRSPCTLAVMSALKQSGVAISIDDFGTGYSSLSYLQSLPIDLIKIDRSFITDLETCLHDQKLVRAVINMAHDLGYRVVAEGVETPGAFDLLQAWGCDEAQGYYIACPLSVDEMASWTVARRTLQRSA